MQKRWEGQSKFWVFHDNEIVIDCSLLNNGEKQVFFQTIVQEAMFKLNFIQE